MFSSPQENLSFCMKASKNHKNAIFNTIVLDTTISRLSSVTILQPDQVVLSTNL